MFRPLPHGADKPNEFKRYRQALEALYITVVALGFLLLAASVVRELFFRPVVQLQGPVLSAENPTREDLMRCHQDVQTLYRDLDRVALKLLALPVRKQENAIRSIADDPLPKAFRDAVGTYLNANTAVDITDVWEKFSQDWSARWDVVNAFCRFSELEETGMGQAYDSMADVHGTLPTMRLKYQNLLVRFDDEQAAELSLMKRELQRSKLLLRRDTQGASEEQAP